MSRAVGRGDEALRGSGALRGRSGALRRGDEAEAVRRSNPAEALRRRDEALRRGDEAIGRGSGALRRRDEALRRGSGKALRAMAALWVVGALLWVAATARPSAPTLPQTRTLPKVEVLPTGAAREVWEAQGGQDAQGTQEAWEAQDGQEVQATQGTQDVQNAQNAQEAQGTQGTQDAQGTQGTQETQTAQDAQAGAISPQVPLSADIQVLLREACDEFGVELALLIALIEQETGFRNVTGDGGRSVGFCQIQPRWWSGLMDAIGARDLSRPEDNFRTACAILVDLGQRYHSLQDVLTAYNSGHGGPSPYAAHVLARMDAWREKIRPAPAPWNPKSMPAAEPEGGTHGTLSHL